MTSTITLYGIPNCDTVKKARTWLQAQGIAFDFHDFKKNGLERSTVESWLQHIGTDLLINRKGSTWRALSEPQKAAAADTEQAIALMLASPSLIKRPLLQRQNGAAIQDVTVGFSADHYLSLFE